MSPGSKWVSVKTRKVVPRGIKASCGCGAIWYGNRLEHCTVCHRTFSGEATGNAHRVGPYNPPGQRRCLEPHELEALGLWLDDDTWHGKPNNKGIQHRREPRK